MRFKRIIRSRKRFQFMRQLYIELCWSLNQIPQNRLEYAKQVKLSASRIIRDVIIILLINYRLTSSRNGLIIPSTASSVITNCPPSNPIPPHVPRRKKTGSLTRAWYINLITSWRRIPTDGMPIPCYFKGSGWEKRRKFLQKIWDRQ